MTALALRDAKQGKAEATQRRAARPNVSVWVAASAGSGKTKVLTDRVLSLMLNGTEPGRILCLTFTRAAAAEMANRLADRLARWAADADESVAADLHGLLGRYPDADMLTGARRLFARVLDVPGGMKIQTIHAFCQSILGRFPLEARVAPHFQVLDERSAAELLESGREDVLSAAADGPLAEAMAEVSCHAQEAGFTDLMAALIRERGRFGRMIRDHGGIEPLFDAIARSLGVDPKETGDAVVETACRDQAVDLMGLHLVTAALAAGSQSDQTRGAAIRAWLDDPDGRAGGFQAYLAAFFTKGGEGERFKTLIHKQALTAMAGADQILESEAARLAAVRARLRSVAVARATAALLRLGAAILEAYERHKAARALLDYDDLILKTRDLLRRPGLAPWVLFKLDGGLDHVLIDESQDTNPEQWEVIEALTAEFFVGEGQRDYPRTVFAVGDPKQSIYSFQRADPAAFAAMRDHFAAKARDALQELSRVALDVSFRSTAAVLKIVDAVFAEAGAQDGVLFGEAGIRHDPVRVGQGGLVELWPPVEAEALEPPDPWTPPVSTADHENGSPALRLPPRTRLARLVARKIWHWTRAEAGASDPGAWLASKGRRLRPEDMLVLVRRRNEFVEELVRELKLLDVPVAGLDRMVLTDQLAVMDLVALGRCLLLPDDDLTLATVLKGPLIGLTEAQLFTLAYGREERLWTALKRHAGTDPAFAKAHSELAALMARADFVPPHELYAEILGRRGGRERLLARLGPEARDPMEEFLSLALAYEREHVPSLEGFLHWLEAGAQEVKRDLEHGADAVRVMTVHGAKGLQAPVVFLPDTCQMPIANRGLLWMQADPARPGQARKDLVGRDLVGKDLVVWPIRQVYDSDAVGAARRMARLEQEREYRRLLYVAMTRAEDRLYVCGWKSRNELPDGCWYRLVQRGMESAGAPAAFDFRDALEGGWAGAGWRGEEPQSVACEADDAGPPLAFAPLALPAWAKAAPDPEPTPPRPLTPSRPAETEPAVNSPLGRDQGYRFRRGLLIHRLLQSLPDRPGAARASAGRRFLASRAHELTSAQQDEILNEVLAVLEDPSLAALFGPDSRAEVPIIGVAGGRGDSDRAGQIIAGQIDRLVQLDRKILVIDYKSNRPPPRTEAEVPALYLRQMAAYRSVLQEIYPDATIRCLLLWTEGPRLMQISDARLADHAP